MAPPVVEVKRRSFLATLVVLPGAILGACRRREVTPAPACAAVASSPDQRALFSPEEWATVDAACARIIPTDQEPGAREAGAVAFIDAQLALPQFDRIRPYFMLGLRKMDALALKKDRRPFAQASVATQDSVLRTLQEGVPLGQRQNSKNFFSILLTFTFEGFACDPVYGGNRGEVGWRFLGGGPKPPRPRCPLRAL
jgi:gluconate 2-dehydrogenase gamma chain